MVSPANSTTQQKEKGDSDGTTQAQQAGSEKALRQGTSAPRASIGRSYAPMVCRGARLTFVDLASRLADGDVSAEVLIPLEGKLLRRYPAFGVWPADSQLGLCLMAWLRGPGFNLVGFRQAVTGLVPDFRAAAQECRLPDWGHSGIAALNSWTSHLFLNGQCVLDWGLRPELIYFPTALDGFSTKEKGDGR